MLFTVGAIKGVQAGTLLTVSDVVVEGQVQRISDDDLRAYARESHEQIRSLLASLTDARLAETIVIPWFPPPQPTLTIENALAQMAMHSHYHRGQNATILRGLGGEPPTTDLIVWHWKGKPAAEWDT